MWRWDVAILKVVRKGFCEKVKLEQNGRLAKESVIREKNVLGTGINRAKTLEWDCSWVGLRNDQGLLWLEQSEKASKTGRMET